MLEITYRRAYTGIARQTQMEFWPLQKVARFRTGFRIMPGLQAGPVCDVKTLRSPDPAALSGDGRTDSALERICRNGRKMQVSNESGPETMSYRFAVLVLCVAMTVLGGCSGERPPSVRPVYLKPEPTVHLQRLSFGVHPLHNPTRLMAMYGPIVAALNSALPEVEIHLEASRDYADYERKLRERSFALVLPNPYQTVVVASPGYRIFGKVAHDEDFHGLILRRRSDGSVREPVDLRGKTFSCPSRTAVAACMMPLMFLQGAGLDVAKDLDVRSVGSQESSILNVVYGLVDAGATWPPPWRAFQREYPDLAAGLEVAWRTESLPNNGLMARTDLDPALVERIAKRLFSLASSEQGRRLLAGAEIAGFEPADEATYAPVRAFLQRYAKRIGPAS